MTDDEVDLLLHAGAPAGVSDADASDAGALDARAKSLARSVAAEAPGTLKVHRIKVLIGSVVALLLVGGTAATAGPGVLTLFAEPEFADSRTFTIDGRTTSCSITIQVVKDSQVTADDPRARDNIYAAREFLHNIDGETIEPDLSVLSENEREITKDMPEENALIQSVGVQVMDRFSDAGLFRYGVSIEGQLECDDEGTE